jgi:3-phosphoglycerate kinase
MANTFLKAEGIPVGASKVESDKLDLAPRASRVGEETRREILASN